MAAPCHMEKDRVIEKAFYAHFNGCRKCPLMCGGKRSKTAEEMSECEKFQIKAATDGTYENYVLKSIIGFLCGILIVYLVFLILISQVRLNIEAATYICSICGTPVVLGLAFSSEARCVALLWLPSQLSSSGRRAIHAYVMILVFTGPAVNIIRNMKILSQTMSCTQGKLREAVRNLVAVLKGPFNAMKETIKEITKKVKEVVNKIKDIITALKKTVQSIIGVITSAFTWLNSIVGLCGKKVGTPFQRCSRVFSEAIADCKVQLGPTFDFVCSAAYVGSTLCYPVKVFDYVCDLIDFVSDGVVTTVKKKLQEFMFQVRNIFYVKIEFSHSFSLSTEQSKTLKEAAKAMKEDPLYKKILGLHAFFDRFLNVMGLMWTWNFLNAIYNLKTSRKKFMTNDGFKNIYLTEKVYQLDMRRTQLGKETIMPLTKLERKRYTKISQLRMMESERKSITGGLFYNGLVSAKVLLIILVDYSLYWILDMIRFHGQFKTYIDSPNFVEVDVSGPGVVAELYASILNSFQPKNVMMDFDANSCLPDPIPPDDAVYKDIVGLLIFVWITIFVNPYVGRLTVAVLSYYHPERAELRAVWLYNNIIKSRGNFLKFARRQLRKKFVKDEEGVEAVSLIDRFRAQFPLLRKLWPGKVMRACLLCGSVESKTVTLAECPTSGCVGKFCVECFDLLKHTCTICKSPIDYGDVSDISEEKDSSDFPGQSGDETEASEEITREKIKEIMDGETGHDTDYQYKPRDPEEKVEVPQDHSKDLEAQQRRDFASIDDYGRESAARRSHMAESLPEALQSGIWRVLGTKDSFTLTRAKEIKQKESSGKRGSTSGLPPAFYKLSEHAGNGYKDAGEDSSLPPAIEDDMVSCYSGSQEDARGGRKCSIRGDELFKQDESTDTFLSTTSEACDFLEVQKPRRVSFADETEDSGGVPDTSHLHLTQRQHAGSSGASQYQHDGTNEAKVFQLHSTLPSMRGSLPVSELIRRSSVTTKRDLFEESGNVSQLTMHSSVSSQRQSFDQPRPQALKLSQHSTLPPKKDYFEGHHEPQGMPRSSKIPPKQDYSEEPVLSSGSSQHRLLPTHQESIEILGHASGLSRRSSIPIKDSYEKGARQSEMLQHRTTREKKIYSLQQQVPHIGYVQTTFKETPDTQDTSFLTRVMDTFNPLKSRSSREDMAGESHGSERSIEIERLRIMNLMRENKKREWEKEISKDVNVWDKVMFWRKREAAGSYSPDIPRSSRYKKWEPSVKKVPSKTIFKRTSRQPNPLKIVYDKFKTEEST